MSRLYGAVSAFVLAATLLLSGTPAAAGTYKQLYAFQGGSDGKGPEASLTYFSGMLLGTTYFGGTGNGSGNGTVFSVNPQTGTESVVHAFQGGTDGTNPGAGLLTLGTLLYGTTQLLGNPNCYITCGTVFSLNPATAIENVVYAFNRLDGDGAVPAGNLINLAGTLYGTASTGGSGNCPYPGCGAVFSINRKTGAETLPYLFQGGSDGYDPQAGLIDVAGKLYGTTLRGGSSGHCIHTTLGCGTVFAINITTGNITTGTETSLHRFQGGTDGALPKAGLINVAGILYGTTSAGGPKNWGTVFSVDLATGKYTVFANAHGISNTGALVRIGAELYGTAYAGGGSRQCSGGCGIIFSFDFKTGRQKIAYSFQGGADGANPAAGLIAVDGTLYGTTYYGGSLNDGTVFSYKP